MNKDLKVMVDAAKAQGACVGGLDKISEFKTVEQALASEYGPTFALWYATKVMRARWTKAEKSVRRDAGCWALYKSALGL
jgi:hypothetical protein